MKKLLILLFCVLLTGCYQIKRMYFINPDGKGKVVIDAVIPVININLSGSDKKPDIEKRARELVEKSAGVDGWKDVRWEETEEGKLHFTGTAYFSDINKLKIGQLGLLKTKMKKEKAKYIITVSIEGKEKEEKKQLSKKEIEEVVEKEKKSYYQMKPMLVGFLSGMKEENIYYLPGKVEEMANFKKRKDGSLYIQIKGQDLLNAIDYAMKDRQLSKKMALYQYSDTKTKEQLDNILYGKIFGQKGKLQIVCKPERDLFNYSEEIKGAVKNIPETQTEKKKAQQLPEGKISEEISFENCTVAGIKIIYFSDMKNGLLPFSSTEGVYLSVLTEFRPKILSLKGEIKKAFSEDGEDILPESRWSRKIIFPSISKDGHKVLLI